MPDDPPWWRHPRVRLRHDMHLWIRHDAARFVRPGFDPADVFPTLGRRRDEARRRAEAAQAAEDAAFAAELEEWRRVQAALQAELNEVRPNWRAVAQPIGKRANTAHRNRASPPATRAAGNGRIATAGRGQGKRSCRMPPRATWRA